MTTSPSSTSDDLAAVRSLLAPADPVPDPTLAREEVLAARASVGLARGHDAPAPRRRGRLAVAGAVAALSVATLVAVVAMPAAQEPETITLATGPGAGAVRAAYTATASTGTARGLLTVTHDGGVVTATGVADFDTGAGRAEIDLAEGGPGGGAKITVIRTADGVYAKLPAGANPLAADRPWVSVDATTLARLAQMALGDLGAQITGAPLDALAYLKAVAGDVQVVGPDTVRGDPTTRYRTAIDPRKVADQLPPALRPEGARAADELGQSLPADLWIDAEGRLRKLVLTTNAPVVEGGEAPSVSTLTVELWDFGAALDATPPPPDQVVDVGGLLGGFLGGAKNP